MLPIKNNIFIVIALAMALMIGSCMSLEKVSIANLRLEYDKKPLRLRGTSLPIGVSVITTDQKRLRTRGFSGGNLKWSNFRVSVEGGNFSNGKIAISGDNPSDTISVRITSVHHPEWEIREVIGLNHLLSIRTNPVEPVVWAPDESFKMTLDSYYDNGQAYTSRLSNKLIKQMNLSMKAEGGVFSGGRFHIFEDFENIPQHIVSLNLESQDNPEVSDFFWARLTYIKNYMFSTSASDAWSGSAGRSGFSGSDGNSDGRCGGRGEDGEDGRHGEDGKNGYDLDIFVDAYSDTILHTDLVYVEVATLGSSATKHYLINPSGGNISIQTRGGDGGNGGTGGNGGSGGNGGRGKEITIEHKDSTGVHYITKLEHGGRGGRGGNGGYGGNGGNGGRGGDIFIHYTPVAKPYLHIIIPESIGGDGGSGGSPGLAGSGGTGGTGNPSGSSGNSGNCGRRGIDGYRGPDGQIIYTLVDN